MGKNKFTLKCFSGKIKCFKAMLVFFFEMKTGSSRTHPASLIPLIFFFVTMRIYKNVELLFKNHQS